MNLTIMQKAHLNPLDKFAYGNLWNVKMNILIVNCCQIYHSEINCMHACIFSLRLSRSVNIDGQTTSAAKSI